MIKDILFIFCIIPSLSFGFVISKTTSGSNIKWDLLYNEIPMKYDPTPVNTTKFELDTPEEGLVQAGVLKSEYIHNRTIEILSESVDEWNQISKYQVDLIRDYSLDLIGQSSNTFRYSDRAAYFGSGVIGVTSISHNTDTGQIISADIMINQSQFATQLTLDKQKSSSQNAYLGDVITHEFGHFLGLGHSEVIGSTMVYSIFKGQHTIASDDQAGIEKNYEIIHPGLGSISGAVVAGRDALSVFGVNVGLFSVGENKLLQSQLSDLNGRFFFENLILNDSYYVMVSPLKNTSSIADYYSTVNNQLCGTDSFRGNFYTKCGERSKSHPQVFRVDKENSKHLNIGSITIKCDEGVNPNYFANKYKLKNRSYEISSFGKPNQLFYGFFSDYEITQSLLGLGDELTLDLRSLDPKDQNLSSLSLKLDFMSTGHGSNYEFRILIRKIGETNFTTYNTQIDPNLKKITDQTINLTLSGNSEENHYEIRIFPIALTAKDQIEIFSVLAGHPDALANKNNLYTISASVGLFTEEIFTPLEKMDSYPYTDNSSCTQGEVTYKTTPLTSKSEFVDDASQSNSLENLGAGCGMIDLDNNDNGGSSGGLISFFIGILVFSFSLFLADPKHKILS